MAELHGALQSSHDLLRRYREVLSSDEQQLIDAVLNGVNITAVDRTSSTSASSTNLLAVPATYTPLTPSPRYLGEASDVFFFNSVKALLRGDTGKHPKDAGVESYEHEALQFSNALEHDAALCLPDREQANHWVDVYFSTIHVAYPFLCKPKFMTDYELFWESTSFNQEPCIFRSLLCKLSHHRTWKWA